MTVERSEDPPCSKLPGGSSLRSTPPYSAMEWARPSADMELTYACLSSQGPVRKNNEDYVGFWEPSEEEQRRTHGAVVVIADGVGGQEKGEVASQLAVETSLRLFRDAKDNVPP